MSSHTVNGKRYFVLFDDAMISMTYAKSLVKGCGLVWYCGAPKVEGITNLGWTLYMALWHILPIPPEKLALPLQITGALTILGILFMVYKISTVFSERETPAVLSALAVATYFPIVYWSLMGMEVGVLSLLLLLAVYALLRYKNRTIVSVIAALGVLIRMDFLIPLFGITLADFLKRRRIGAFVPLFSALATLSLILAFRLLYYGDVFPNTYYLKVYGFPLWIRVVRGILNLVIFTFAHPVHALLIAAALSTFKNDKKLYLLLPFLLYVAYQIYVGGDAWEGVYGNRFIATVLPLGMVAAADKVGMTLGKWVWVILPASLISVPTPKHIKRAISGGEKSGIVFHILRKYVYLANPRKEPAISYHKTQICKALYLNRRFPEDIRVGVVWAGIIPYFAYGKEFVDMLGKNDRYISHIVVNLKNPLEFVPGHNKYDYNYIVHRLKPDVLTNTFYTREKGSKALDTLLHAHYRMCDFKCEDRMVSVFVRKDAVKGGVPLVRMCEKADRSPL